jgi:ketosteroid isomerase-like protein
VGVDEAAVAKWLDEYVAAWQTYDAAGIGSLFSEDAVYRFHPWDDGDDAVRGREAIVSNWLDEPDAPGTWSAEYAPWLVDGDRAVATGVTRYLAEEGVDGEQVEREYHNVFLLRFDADGRCAEFTELYMSRPS